MADATANLGVTVIKPSEEVRISITWLEVTIYILVIDESERAFNYEENEYCLTHDWECDHSTRCRHGHACEWTQTGGRMEG